MKEIEYIVNREKRTLTISEGEVSYEKLVEILQDFVIGDKCAKLDPRKYEDFVIFKSDIKLKIS